MAHTPGPWKLARGSYVDNVYGSNGALVVHAEAGTDDMLLIAAAPELLAVCEALYEMTWHGPVFGGPGPWMPKQPISNDLLQRIGAAVRKARGESEAKS